MLIEHLDQLVQVLITDDALSGCGGVEVGDIDDACQPGVLTRDSTNRIGQGFTQANCG